MRPSRVCVRESACQTPKKLFKVIPATAMTGDRLNIQPSMILARTKSGAEAHALQTLRELRGAFGVRLLQHRSLEILALLLLLAALASVRAAERDEWRNQMQPLTPNSYLCPHIAAPIRVDGKLDDAAWASAPWTGNFVDIRGATSPAPRFRTRAKMLWDDEYLYVAAELEEPHVWATLTNHDAVIFQDSDFEVFVDPDGDTHNYYEFEINALNTTWDLRLDKPYRDEGKPRNDCEIPGMKTAVQVRGTLNNPADTDSGWTVELAFPWKVLSERARHTGPPTDGEQWRINFSRVEWRVSTNSAATNGIAYEKVSGSSEDNWVWSPQGVVDMHRPEMWGLVQFTRQSAP